MHNFIQEQAVKHLGPQCHNFEPISGYGWERQTTCLAKTIYWGTNHLAYDCFRYWLLHITYSDAKVVSRVQWLKTLGPMLIGYSNLTMQFTWQDQQVLLWEWLGLTGVNLIKPFENITYHQFHFWVLPPATNINNSNDLVIYQFLILFYI